MLFLLAVLLAYVANPLSIKYQNKIRDFLKSKISEKFTYEQLEIRSLPLPSVIIKGLKSEQELGVSFNIPKATLYINPFNIFWNNNGLIWSAKIEHPVFEVRSKSSPEFDYLPESFNYDSATFIFSHIPRISTYSVATSFKQVFLNEIKIHSFEIIEGSVLIYKSGILKSHFDKINFDSKFEISNNYIKLKKSHLSAIFERPESGSLVSGSLMIGGVYNIELHLFDTGFLSLAIDGSAFLKDEKRAYSIAPFTFNSAFYLTEQELIALGAESRFSLGGNLKIRDVNIQISPFYSKSNLALFINANGEYEGSVNEIPFQFQSIFEVRADTRLWSNNLTLNNQSKIIEISLPQIERLKQNVITASNSSIVVGSDLINFSTTLDLEKSQYSGILGIQNLKFKQLQQELLNFGLDYKLPNLNLTGRTNFNYLDTDLILSSDDITISDLRLENTNFSISNTVLKEFSLKFRNLVLRDFASKIEISNLEAKLPFADKYKVKKLNALISVKKRKKYSVLGNLSMNNFEFTDGYVDIKDINVELNKISASYSDQAGLLAETILSGNKIRLNTPDFSISSLSSLTGPLKLKVDNKGKYLIEGKGDTKQADMTLFKKQILASGVVDFMISGPIKSFATNNLSGTINSKAFVLSNTAIDMTEDAYKVNNSNLEIFKGKVNVAGKWGRGPNPYKLSLDSEGLDLSEFAYIFPEEGRPNLSGKFKKLYLDIKGTKGDPSSVSGNGKITFEKGILKSLELDSILGNPVIGVKEGEPDPGTYVENLDLEFNLDNSLVKADNFVLAGRFYTFKGSGAYSLTEGFKVNGSAVYLEKTLSEFGGPIKLLRKLLGSLTRIEIPVRIKGPIEDPVVDADLTRVMSILSPGRAVRSIGEGVGDILGGIKDVVTGE